MQKSPISMANNNTNHNTIMSPITLKYDSDYDSMSSMSFGGGAAGGRRSSVSSSSSSFSAPGGLRKPHKANQAAWEAMHRLRLAGGRAVGLDHFRLLRRLGSGDLGSVYLCQIRNPVVGLPQCFYAMKVVDREALAIRKKLQRAEVEKEILAMLDHPFLPTLYAEFEASHYSCLVMEFCPGGDLYSARQRQPGKRFSISSAKFYAAETILALEYLHMMGIVYRDLKPENVLVREDGHIMLSDFDLSLKCDVVPRLVRSRTKALDRNVSTNDIKRCATTMTTTTTTMPSCAAPMQPVLSCFSAARRLRRKQAVTVTTITECADDPRDQEQDHYDDDHDQGGVVQMDGPELVAEPINARSKSFVGTHEYLAPEVISGQGHGSAVDWWTLGVFLYEMLYGRTPFKGENNEKTLINILKQPLTFPRTTVNGAKEFEEMVKVQDLISKLLVKNPKKRIGSLKGSVEIKRHEFFKGVNWALIRSVKPPEVPRDLINKRNNHNINNVNLRRSAPNYVPKLSKKEREEPYQIPHHVDYF